MHEARRQAELELFDLFHIPDNRNVSYVFDKMDITRDGESNAILLAISATLQVGRSEGVLSELISKIASEIAESGMVENESIREQIQTNGMKVDAVSVRRNLEERYTSLGIGDYVIPPFEDYLDINGNGVIDKNDSWLILNKTDFRFSSDGGTIEIEVQHNVDFEVIVEDDDFENDWVIQSDQTKAYLETGYLTFTVLPNETYDDRVARIILRDKSSGCEDAVYVFQKQLDALTVSASRFEVPKGGGKVEIEVQSNVDYTAEIQNDCRSWIKNGLATKSLSSSVLVFDIAESFDTGMRHGRIVLSDGNLSETIDVYQSGGNRIILDKKDHTVSAKGGVVQIEVSSNFDYEMIMPEVDWVSEIMQTKGLATGTRTFRIAQNETYDDRYAEITFRDRSGTVEEKATIWQTQKDAIIIARDEYEIGNEGGEITIEIQANVDFKTRVANYCQSWIEPVPMTKGLTDYSFRFKVLPHEDYDGRSGEIYIYNNDTEKYIRVVQGPKKALEVNTKEYNVPAQGGVLRIGFDTNLTCRCVYTDPEAESWLVLAPETKGIHFDSFTFNVSPNEDYSLRRTQLVIESEDGSCRETVTVTQDPKGALNVGQTEYNVPYMAGELAIEVESSIDYVSEVVEGSEWLSFAPVSKSLEISSVKMAFTKNETYVERVGKVKIYDTKNSLEAIVTITQAPNGDTRVIHVETPGTLSQLIDKETLINIRSLKLTGTVSSTDLAFFEKGTFLTETLDLSELTVQGGVINTFGNNRGAQVITSGEYSYFGQLKTVYLPPTLKTLGKNAFRDCRSLENIVFGENSQLTNIEGGSSSGALGGVYIQGAFSGCSSLKSVTLPASLKRLHGGAFYNCENLESVTFEEGSKMTTIQGDVYSAGGMGGTSYYDYAGIFSHCQSLRKLEIPASVETIGDYAFCGTNGLVSIVIPETVKYVSSSRMFSGCTSLESVSLPSSFKEFGYEMFSGCPNLKEIRTASDIAKIGDYAFKGCTSMTEIDLGNFSSVGVGAFSESGLTSVRIPDAMKELPEELFQKCNGLKNVDLNKVERIGSRAFQECNSLESIVIPKTIKFIGSYAFNCCENLKEFTLSGGDRITLDNGILNKTKVSELVIPAEVVSIVSAIKDYGPLDGSEIYSIVFEENSKCEEFGIAAGSMITTIALPSGMKKLSEAAFKNCKCLSEVTLPKDIQIIPNNLFEGCSALTEFEIPSSVITLGQFCFSGSALESINVPEGVKRIEAGAFSSCESLYEITLPNTLEYIGANVFYNCLDLAPFVLNGAETLECGGGLFMSYYGSYTACPSISKIVVGKNVKKLVGRSPTLTSVSNIYIALESEGSALEEIGDNFFSGCRSTTVVLPQSVKKIGDGAFAGSWIQEFVCPAGLTIGNGAFEDSTIKKVTFEEGCQTIGDNFFKLCRYLEKVIFPSTLISIGDRAFEQCEKIKNLELPVSLTSIGSHAFRHCKGLTEISLPESLISIGSRAFGDCSNLMKLELPKSLISIGEGAFAACTGLTTLEFPTSLTSIGREAFKGCTGLTTLELPSSLMTIEYRAFYGCTGIKKVTLSSNVKSFGMEWMPSTVESVIVAEGVTSLGDNAFKNYANVDVVLPSTLISIGNSCFSGCKGITGLELPASLISIGNSAFSGCTGLQNLTLPSSLTSIGNYCFSGCTGLRNFVLHEGLTSIGEYALSGCSALETVTISEGVTTLPYRIFQNCTGLREVTLPKSLTSMGSRCFEGCTSLQNLTLQSDLSSAYDCFTGCTALESVTISEGVTTLLYSIFQNCTGLREITLPKSLTSIGESAFSGCTGLQNLTLPSNLTKIESSAFSGCEALETVVIPESVTTIGYDAFKNTSPHITWNTSSSEISASSAFNGCTGRMDIGGYGVPYRFYEYVLSKSNLSGFNLLDGIKVIGSYAFTSMKETVAFTIPESVVEIKANAFYGCTFAGNIDLPSSLETIGSSAFTSCTGLTELILPASVTTIGDSSFTGTSIREVRCNSLVPPKLGNYSSRLPFDRTDQPAIFVPAAALDAYKAATGWKEYELQGF